MTSLKNKFLKLIMAGLLVLTTIAFISCGGNQNPDNEKGSGGGGSGSGSSSGSGSGNDTSGILTAEQSAARLKEIGDYDIVVEVVSIGNQAMSMEMAKKGNTYWFKTVNVSMAYKLEGDNCYSYAGMEDESGAIKWMCTGSTPSDTLEGSLEQMDTAFAQTLFYAGDLVAGLTKSGTATIAGRNCTKYTWSETASSGGTTASAQETIYVDNETGICMKMVASDTVNGVSESGSFEVTKFLTGSSVQAPTLPAPENE